MHIEHSAGGAAKLCESAAGVTGVLELASSMETFAINGADLDAIREEWSGLTAPGEVPERSALRSPRLPPVPPMNRNSPRAPAEWSYEKPSYIAKPRWT